MMDNVAFSNSEKQPSLGASGAKMYERVENLICQRIREGTLKPGARLDNIEQLAEELDVSSGTVRHSLQNLAARGILVRRPRAGTFVAGSDARRFGPAPAVRRAETAQSVLLLLLPDIRQPEYAHLARAIQDAARVRHTDVLIANTDDQVDRFEEAIGHQLSANAGAGGSSGGGGNDAIVMIPPTTGHLPLSLMSEIQKSRIGVVTIFRAIPTIGWPAVVSDVVHDVELTARHLCDIGCKRIALADQSGGPSEAMHTKHYAFLRALMSAQRTPHAELVMRVPGQAQHQQQDERRALIRQWLARHPDVDGICCIDDALAAEVMAQLAELGRRVPADVAVTGIGHFAHFRGAGDAAVLTTVDPGFDDLAEQVFALLNRMRAGGGDGEAVPEETRVAVKGRLVLGGSTSRQPHGKRTPTRQKDT
jgi:DNA-binding LacI/PurR family transcriptional regulator